MLWGIHEVSTQFQFRVLPYKFNKKSCNLKSHGDGRYRETRSEALKKYVITQLQKSINQKKITTNTMPNECHKEQEGREAKRVTFV